MLQFSRLATHLTHAAITAIFIACSLLGYPNSAIASDSVVDLPRISPTQSHKLTRARTQVSATELVSYTAGDTDVVVQLSVISDGRWTTQTIASLPCACSAGDAYLSENFIALFLQDNINDKGYLWLIGRRSDDSWVEKKVLYRSNDHFHTMPLNDGIVLQKFNEGNLQSTSGWRISNDQWELLEETDFPQNVFDLYLSNIMAGNSDDLIIHNKTEGELVNHFLDSSGMWQMRVIEPLGNTVQNDVHQAELKNNTLLVHARLQDADMPNRGAVHVFTRTNGEWINEATIFDNERQIENINSQSTSAFLLDDATAIIQHQVDEQHSTLAREPTADRALVYERTGNAEWIPTADINSGIAIKTVFIDDDVISWTDQTNYTQDRNNFHLAGWRTMPDCTTLSDYPTDSGRKVCQTASIDLTLSSYGNVVQLKSTDRDSLVKTNTATRERIRFINITETDEYDIRALNIFDFDPETEVIDKKTISLCPEENPERYECKITTAVLEDDTAFVTMNNTLYQLTEVSGGNWRTDVRAFPHAAAGVIGEYGDVFATSIQGDTATVYSTNTGDGNFRYRNLLHILKRRQNQWVFDNSIELAPLSIYTGSYDVHDITHHGNRIAVRSGPSKIQLFYDNNEPHIWFESTIKPHNSPDADYRTNALFEDSLIVGGPMAGKKQYLCSSTGGTGIAKIFKLAGNEWEEAQTLHPVEADHHCFGQQVYMEDELAIVVAFRNTISQTRAHISWYDPTYYVYRKGADGNFQLERTIYHSPGTSFLCLDCEFTQQIRWPAKLIDGYLFLPVINSTEDYAYTGEHGVQQYDFNFVNLNKTCDDSTPGTNCTNTQSETPQSDAQLTGSQTPITNAADNQTAGTINCHI